MGQKKQKLENIAIKRMKMKKAVRIDGISMEAWKHAKMELWKKLVVMEETYDISRLEE